MTGYQFGATRPGEYERACERCGAAFQPASRNQKYCPGCRTRAKAARGRKLGGPEISCQNADEQAAGFADAPTLKTPDEAAQTGTLALGA